MAPVSILVVDADAASREFLARELRRFGHDVSESENAASAIDVAQRKRPDLMVCDLSLPDVSGVELMTDVRRDDDLCGIRVLLTSSSASPDDVLIALESGADDFIGKPINRHELRARVGACLRRPANLRFANALSAGGITVDGVGHRVVVDGQHVALAPKEFRLLEFLLGNPDRVFSRRQLLMHLWERDGAVGPRTVDVHVRRLRSLLEPFGYDAYLQTVRGSGYRFSLEN